MTTTTVTHGLDAATVERLATAFNRSFETGEDPDEVLAPDVFFDLYPPFWRFQLQGRDTIQAQLRMLNEGSEVTSRILRAVPTADGFLLEHEEISRGEHSEVARKLWVCVVRDGQIVEATCYCNGGWDDELQARQAAEAPMLRP
jgi:ketosteroid isomerase-like protein